MSDDKENEFERDFSENTEETSLGDEASDLTEENALESNNESLEDISKKKKKEIDPIAEANESLITMNSAPFDQTLEIMSQTLASIDNKMDIENSQLQKLDQLSEIKDQLNRLENISVASASSNISSEPEITPETSPEVEEELPQNNMGHNQQEISELLEKIEILEKKLLTIEDESNNSNERFKKIESVVERFEDLESEIHIEYEEDEKTEKTGFFKNLFKKKNKTEPNKENAKIKNSEMSLTEVKKNIPKYTEDIIEQAENNLKNTTSEILINDNYQEDQLKEEKVTTTKTKDVNSGLAVLILLCVIIVVLFYFDKFQLIDLDFVSFINRINSIVNSVLK